MRCPSCAADNPDSFGFCAQCHEPLGGTLDGVTVYPAAPGQPESQPPPRPSPPPPPQQRQARGDTGPTHPAAPPGTSGTFANTTERIGGILGGRFRLDGKLGSGGMGAVYKAHDMKLDVPVALKRLHGDRVGPEQEMRREIALARSVTHENVCRVYDLEEFDGREYLSMEYVEGRTLKEVIVSDGKLPTGRALAIAKQVCRGVAAIQRLGIVHRDLKPENVMIGAGDRVRIMDFGIARLAGARSGSSTALGGVVGTPQYMSPEQVSGEPLDARSDIYSIGALLYEALTARKPYAAETLPEWLFLLLNRAPDPPHQVDPTVPVPLSELVLRCMERERNKRPGTAMELLREIEDLERLLVDAMSEELERSRGKLNRLLLVLETNSRVHSAGELDPLLRLVLEIATSQLKAERSTVFVVNEASGEIHSKVLTGGQMLDIKLPIATGIAGAAVAEGRPIRVDEPYADPRFHREVDEQTGYVTRSILAVPIREPGGRVLGVVQALNKRRGPFDAEDEEFLTLIGEHIGLAIRNAWTHEQSLARERLGEELRLAKRVVARLSEGALPRDARFEAARRGAAHGAAAYDGLVTNATGGVSLAAAEAPEHRLAGALELTAFATAFRLLAGLPLSLSERVARVRTELAAVGGESQSLAALFADFDPQTGDLALAGMGLGALYRLRGNTWQTLSTGPPPGVSAAQAPLAMLTDRLAPGDALVVLHGAPPNGGTTEFGPAALVASLPVGAGGMALQWWGPGRA